MSGRSGLHGQHAETWVLQAQLADRQSQEKPIIGLKERIISLKKKSGG